MLTSAAPIPPDYRLPEDAYWHVIRILRVTLPPPPDASAEALLQRDHAAIATIGGLAPGNIAEARQAALYVAASEQWSDCLRVAELPETAPDRAAQCRAQAATMMRAANSAMRVLLHMQAARRRLEADSVLSARADRTDHVATVTMAAALEAIRAAPARPAAAPSTAPAPSPAKPVPASAVAGRADPERVHGAADPSPHRSRAVAELYAAIYPERAALIRRLGRVPDNVTFGPPDDDLVQALITARTPALTALDHAFPKTRAA
jgi:hypothetical protein